MWLVKRCSDDRILATNLRPSWLLVSGLLLLVSAWATGCEVASESGEEDMLPTSSGFVPATGNPPPSPPEVYLVDDNRVPV